jgi:hypothetical protein
MGREGFGAVTWHSRARLAIAGELQPALRWPRGTADGSGGSVRSTPFPMKLCCATALSSIVIWCAGCASTTPPPRLAQPAAYELDFPVAAAGGESTRGLEVTQTVTVPARELLYYRVDSPVEVTVSVYEGNSARGRTLLGQMRGNRFTTSVMPTTTRVEFHVSTTPPVPEVPVRLHVANTPIPVAAAKGLAVAAE